MRLSAGVGSLPQCLENGISAICSRSGQFLLVLRPLTKAARQLGSVSLTGIDSQQSLARTIDKAHHRLALEFRLRRRVCPELFWLIDSNVVPDDARAIMFSHRV